MMRLFYFIYSIRFRIM